MKWIHVAHGLVVWFAFSSASLFCLVCLLPHYQDWTSLRDLRRRCVVNILTLNTVNQQSYNECQLYYFYSRKIKTFPISRSKLCVYLLSLYFRFEQISKQQRYYTKFNQQNIKKSLNLSFQFDAFFHFSHLYGISCCFTSFLPFPERRSSWYIFEEK